MKKLILFLLLLIAFNSTAQQTISGTFTPAEEYKWLIAYRLKPGTQEYAVDTAVKEGKFTLNMPADAAIGTYRIVYAVPQEEFYFDVLYNGKENIELTFNDTDGVTFTTSENNILFQDYFKEINGLEQELINFYTSLSTDKKKYGAILKRLKATQQDYEKKSQGLLVEHFIKANRPYIPNKYLEISDYVENGKNAYFDHLDFTDPMLQSSTYLSDKVLNYTFTALPLAQVSPEETELAIQENITTVAKHLSDIEDIYKLHLLYSIWTQAKASGFNATADFVYNSYIKRLALAANKPDVITAIELHNRLRLGAVAPEITWKDGKELKTLSAMEGAEHYVLVFWSSGCSHCLRELPELEKNLKDNASVKVLAVGLEDDATIWNQESARLASFEHAISLGKWESEYANLYNISSTPTYFVLDSDKKIIAKPENNKKVLEFLTSN